MDARGLRGDPAGRSGPREGRAVARERAFRQSIWGEVVRNSRYCSAADIAVRIQRGGGTWPYETPATIGRVPKRCQFHRAPLQPGRCDEALHRPPSQDETAETNDSKRGADVRTGVEVQGMWGALRA